MATSKGESLLGTVRECQARSGETRRMVGKKNGLQAASVKNSPRISGGFFDSVD